MLQLLPRLPGGTQIFVKTSTGKTITVNVTMPSGKTVTLDVGAKAQLWKLKTLLHDKEGIDPWQQRLIFEDDAIWSHDAEHEE